MIRTDKVSPLKLQVFSTALAEQKAGRKWLGFAAFPASLARGIQLNECRALCVWEDPTEAEEKIPANEAHALLVANHDIEQSDALEIRAKLWRFESVQALVPVL